MNHNLLLAFLTEVGSGDWSKYRKALEWLAHDDEELYPSTQATNLSMLGHVEFSFYDDIRWAVCPASLVWLPYTGKPTAVLAGGRSQRLIDDIYGAANSAGIQIAAYDQEDGPDAIFIAAESASSGRQLAEAVGLSNEPDAASQIARCLPPLDSYVSLCPTAPEPSGYAIRVVDPAAVEWVEVPESTEEGLYRYEYYRPEFRLRIRGSCLRTTREVGIYAALRDGGRNVLNYDPGTKELAVPVRAPLPGLFARCATLCSGFLPTFQRLGGVPSLLYRGVPYAIARAIARGLQQTLEV